jgi:hypothetical protein
VLCTGFVGGIGGLPALVVELPLSTVIMLRSIADIARSQGEDLHSTEARLACLEVFALGGQSPEDRVGGYRYFAVRGAMATAVSEAAQFIAERGLAVEGAPVIVRLISRIAGRFGVITGEKVAAQALPLIGAAGGAVLNSMFINHFQDVATGHFVIRRLERAYGPETVRAEYGNVG